MAKIGNRLGGGSDSSESSSSDQSAPNAAQRAVNQDQSRGGSSGGSSSSGSGGSSGGGSSNGGGDPTPFAGALFNPRQVSSTADSVDEQVSGGSSSSSGGGSGGESGGTGSSNTQLGAEMRSDRVGDQARELESSVVENSKFVDDPSQVKITRSGDKLEASFTEVGRRNAQKAVVRRGGIRQKARAVRNDPQGAVDRNAAGVGAARAVDQSPDEVANPLAGMSSEEKQAANKRMIGSLGATTRGASDEFTTDRVSPAERGKADIGGAIGAAQDFAQESYDSTVGAAGRKVEQSLESATGVEFTRSGSGGGILASEEAVERHDAALDTAAAKTFEGLDALAGAYDTIDISDEIDPGIKTGIPAEWAVAGPPSSVATSITRGVNLHRSSRGLSSIDDVYRAANVGRTASTGTSISGGAGGSTATANIIDKSLTGAKLSGAAGAGTLAAGELVTPAEQSFKRNEFDVPEGAEPVSPSEFTVDEGTDPTSPSEFTVNEDTLATSPTEFELSDKAEPVATSELSIPDQSGTGAGFSASQLTKQRQRPGDGQGGRGESSSLQEELEQMNERFEGADQPENLLDEGSIREGRRSFTDAELDESGVREMNERVEESQQPEVVDEAPTDLDASRDTAMMDEAVGTSPMTGVGTGGELDARTRTSQQLGSDVAQDISQDIDQDIRLETVPASLTTTSSGLGMGNPNRTGNPNEPRYPGMPSSSTAPQTPPRLRDGNIDFDTGDDDDRRRFNVGRGEFSNPVFSPGEVISGEAFADVDDIDEVDL